jgi:hypothetical protein
MDWSAYFRVGGLLAAMPDEPVPLRHAVGNDPSVMYTMFHIVTGVYDAKGRLCGFTFMDRCRWYFPKGEISISDENIRFRVKAWKHTMAPRSVQTAVRLWHQAHPNEIPHDPSVLPVEAQQHAIANASGLIPFQLNIREIEHTYAVYLRKHKIALLTALHDRLAHHPLYSSHIWHTIFETAWPAAAPSPYSDM